MLDDERKPSNLAPLAGEEQVRCQCINPQQERFMGAIAQHNIRSKLMLNPSRETQL